MAYMYVITFINFFYCYIIVIMVFIIITMTLQIDFLLFFQYD